MTSLKSGVKMVLMKNFLIGTYLLIKHEIIILPESLSIIFKIIKKFILESPYLIISIIIFFFAVFFLGVLVGKEVKEEEEKDEKKKELKANADKEKEYAAVEKAVKLKESGKAKKVDKNK